MLEMLVSPGNPRIYSNTNLSLVDLTYDGIVIQHPEYYRKIIYSEISTIERKRGVKIELDNGEIITFAFHYIAATGIQGGQFVKNAARSDDNFRMLLERKIKEFKKEI